MFFDAHTHLNSDELYPDWQQHLDHFVVSWWSGLVCVWVNDVRNRRALSIVKQAHGKYPEFSCFATAGIHPSEVSFGSLSSRQEIDKAIDVLHMLIEENRKSIVAVGECGIDAHYPGYKQHQDLQRYLFFQQCQLAKDCWLPLVVHSRDAFEETVNVLARFADLPIYMHCRSYNLEQILSVIERFSHLWIWFCGNITYPNATALRESLLSLNTHPRYGTDVFLLLETDAPWLAPQWYRGKKNVPAYIPVLYKYVGLFLDREQEELIHLIWDARQKLFDRTRDFPTLS